MLALASIVMSGHLVGIFMPTLKFWLKLELVF